MKLNKLKFVIILLQFCSINAFAQVFTREEIGMDKKWFGTSIGGDAKHGIYSAGNNIPLSGLVGKEEGTISILAEKFYGIGQIEIPFIIHCYGDISEISISMYDTLLKEYKLSQGRNFIRASVFLRSGYNEIPISVKTPHGSYKCHLVFNMSK